VTTGGGVTRGGAQTEGGAVTTGGGVTRGGAHTEGRGGTGGGGVTTGGAQTAGGAETAGGAVSEGGAVTTGGGVTRGGAEITGRGGTGGGTRSVADVEGQVRAPEAVPGPDVALLVSGMMIAPALAAARVLRPAGTATVVPDIPVIKPLDAALPSRSLKYCHGLGLSNGERPLMRRCRSGRPAAGGRHRRSA